MSIQEQHALLPLLGDSQHSPLADLEAVLASIQAQITDLERDYAPRDRQFWQASLDLLVDLRRALQPLLQFVEEHRDIASSLVFPLQLLHIQFERIDAAMTSYLPRCQSYAKSRVRQRHALLNCFRMVRDRTQECITLVKSIHEEQAPPMPAPSPLRLARRGPGSLADLDATIALIREQIVDLERDDSPHDRQFWQALIDHLLHLQQVIQPFFSLLQEYSETTFPLIYPLIYPLHILDAKIDVAGIMITVHLPRCRSKSRIKERHSVLMELWKLEDTALQLIVAITAIEEAQAEQRTDTREQRTIIKREKRTIMMKKQSKIKESEDSQQEAALKPKRQRKTRKRKEQNGSGLLHITDERLLFHLERVRHNKEALAEMDACQLPPGLRNLHEQLLLQAIQLETVISTEQSRRQQATRMSGGLA